MENKMETPPTEKPRRTIGCIEYQALLNAVHLFVSRKTKSEIPHISINETREKPHVTILNPTIVDFDVDVFPWRICNYTCDDNVIDAFTHDLNMYWNLAKVLNGLRLMYDDTKDVPDGNVATHFIDDESNPFWQDMKRMDDYEKKYYDFLCDALSEKLDSCKEEL